MTQLELLYKKVEAVMQGAEDPLLILAEVQGAIKEIEAQLEAYKEIKTQLQEYGVNEFDRYGEKKLERHGVVFEKRSTPPKYEYEVDDEYCSRKALLDNRIDLLKQARKAYEKGQSLVIDGEEIQIVPVTGGKEYLLIK